MARSTNGCDTAASVQSKTRVVAGPWATFHGWRSPWTRVGPGPSSSRRLHDPARAGADASHRSRTSAGIRPSSTASSDIASTCAARSVSDRTGSPSATSSSVRPSHDCWIPACATTPWCHRDWSWSPSPAAPRSRISSQPRSASTAITSGTSSGIASARACVAAASCRKMSALHLRKASPSVDEQRRTTDRPQSWCSRGAPTTGRPSAAIRSTIQVEARSNHPGVDHCGRSGDQPSARSRAHEATAARDVLGSSRAITSASRSCRVHPAGGSVVAASNSSSMATSASSAASTSLASTDEVRPTAGPPSSRCRPRRRRPGCRPGSAPLRSPAASAASEAWRPRRGAGRDDQDGGASRMRDQQGHLTGSPTARDRSCPEPSTDPAAPGSVAPRPSGSRRDTPVRTRHAV